MAAGDGAQPPDSSEEGSQGDDPEMMWTTAVLLLLLPRLLHSTVRMRRSAAPFRLLTQLVP